MVGVVRTSVMACEERRDGTPWASFTRGNDLSGSLEGAGGIGGLLAFSLGYTGGTFTNSAYYHADGNGNITYLATTNQTMYAKYRYDAFGNLIFALSSGWGLPNPYRFSSKEFHAASGMYYYGYRWYHPDLQRWGNRDPLWESGADILHFGGVRRPLYAERSPDGPNLYRFVKNEPIRHVDVNGEFGQVMPAVGVGWGGCRIIGRWVRRQLPNPPTNDKKEHCITSCQMTKIGGDADIPEMCGDLREFLARGADSAADQASNKAGRDCASEKGCGGKQPSCEECCRAKGY